MAKEPLGRMERVDLREYWQREDTEFTPWLADEGNIALLGETIELELEVQEQEANVGPYRADILCRSLEDNSLVLIENQLEVTDHTHLGQLMTYAAGLDAVTVVWIASRITEEHRAALDWLNTITEEGFNFFGLEVELWRIGDPAPAPKFNVVAQPNDWRKTVRAMSAKGSTPAQRTYYEFWERFSDHMAQSGSHLRRLKPQVYSWLTWGLGSTNVTMGATCSIRENTVSVWVDLYGPSAKPLFPRLLEQRVEIERELGELMWEERPDRRDSVIRLRRDGGIADQDAWPELQRWLLENLEKFDRVFRPRVRELVAEEAAEV